MITDKEFLFTTESDGTPTLITYNQGLDIDILKVLQCLNSDDFKFYDKVAVELNMTENYVELILHITSDLDLTEYGTSPRGSWLTEDGRKYLEFRKAELGI